MNRVSIAFAAAVIMLPMSFQPAFAAGGGGGGADDAVQCRSGLVWDKKKKKCVQQESSNISDDDLLDSGIAFAYAGRYDDAIAALTQIANKNTPEVWNFLGYATRKSGKLAEGLAFYKRALAIDPDYTLARAYMGEAYLTAGDRGAAVAQLGEIERRSGRGSEAYLYLAGALSDRTLY